MKPFSSSSTDLIKPTCYKIWCSLFSTFFNVPGENSICHPLDIAQAFPLSPGTLNFHFLPASGRFYTRHVLPGNSRFSGKEPLHAHKWKSFKWFKGWVCWFWQTWCQRSSRNELVVLVRVRLSTCFLFVMSFNTYPVFPKSRVWNPETSRNPVAKIGPHLAGASLKLSGCTLPKCQIAVVVTSREKYYGIDPASRALKLPVSWSLERVKQDSFTTETIFLSGRMIHGSHGWLPSKGKLSCS